MINQILLLTAVLSLTASVTSAQNENNPSRTIFKLSPQHFIDNSLKAGVERFNKTHSVSTAYFLTGTIEKNSDGYYDESYSGLAAEFQLRRYISPLKEVTGRHGKNFYQGIYGAAYLQGGYYSDNLSGTLDRYDPVTGGYTSEPYDYKEVIRNGGFGFTIGYQKSLWQVVFLEAFIGGGIQFASSELEGLTAGEHRSGHSGVTDPDFTGILPKIGLHIGIGL